MVYLIYGPPCSGKTTYVQEHMQRGDIVADVDLIYSAISGDSPHNAEIYVHEMAVKLMSPLYDIIRDRCGGWKDAYVVSLACTPEQVEEAKARVDADEVIFLDTPMETCMERAKDRPFFFQYIIQEWFNVQRYHREVQD